MQAIGKRNSKLPDESLAQNGFWGGSPPGYSPKKSQNQQLSNRDNLIKRHRQHEPIIPDGTR